MKHITAEKPKLRDWPGLAFYRIKSPLGRFLRYHSAKVGLTIMSILVIAGIFAPTVAPYSPTKQQFTETLQSPSMEHIMGTDQYGRDVFSRIVYGARISLKVGFLVVAISGTLGLIFGFLAGFYEGWRDVLISRSIDVLLAFPSLLLALGIVTILGPSLFNALLAVSIAQVPRYARVTRGMVLSQKQREYVSSAQAIGATNLRIMRVHLLPNVFAPVLVVASLGVGIAILITSSLSFLGLGAQPPEPEWGAMLSDGRSMIYRAWWVTVFPGIAIMLTVLGVNLIGDSLRDIVDPRTQSNLNA